MRRDLLPDDLSLPDFCGIRTVFALVLGGELLACVLVLAQSATPASVPAWRQLALASLFVQWVALSSAALLCAGRRALARLGDIGAGVAGYCVVLVVTAVLSELALVFVIRPEAEIAGILDGLGRAAVDVPASAPFVLRNVAVSAIVAAVALRYFYIQDQWRRNLESEARSRIQALQSRIRPHFLFNSMNTIASLTRSDPAVAEQVTEDLAHLFRVTLADASVPATLGNEIEVCRQYLRIEQLRLGERLRTRFEVDALPEDASLPALTLQPLVENAVYHGIEPSATGGAITLRGGRDGARLRIEVENSRPEGSVPRTREGHRMALDNVAQRIGAFFEGAATLHAEEGADMYRVVLDLPYERNVRL